MRTLRRWRIFCAGLYRCSHRSSSSGSVEEPITKYAPELANSAYLGMRLKDVLQMSSGARWTGTNSMTCSLMAGSSAPATTWCVHDLYVAKVKSSARLTEPRAKDPQAFRASPGPLLQ
jgi:hypothetical protein